MSTDAKPIPTVAELLDDYNRDCELRGCRLKSSLPSETKVLNQYFGGLTADQITKAVLRESQSKQLAAGVAPATVNKRLAVLHAALAVAAENEKIDVLPKFPKKLRPAKPRQGFFERADYLAMREALRYQWAKDILDFGYYSGWRRDEVLYLTWSEVDMTGKHVRIDPDRSKNHRGRLPLPLADFALEMMERRYAEKEPEDELVFLRDAGCTTSRRVPVHRTTWHAVWREAAKKTGRPELLFHDLRRTVARNLELAGVPRSVAMGWIGHKTELMYSRYSIVNEKDLIPAAAKFLNTITGRESESSEKEEASRLRVVARFREPEVDDSKLFD